MSGRQCGAKTVARNAFLQACIGNLLGLGLQQLSPRMPLMLLAPFFLAFEIWQLVISERYLGIKQIARGADPRDLGLREITAFFWSTGLIFYWLWMLALVLQPVGRAQAACLIAITLVGFSLRRNCTIKWVLVLLTLEGAVRIGMLGSLCVLAWRKL